MTPPSAATHPAAHRIGAVERPLLKYVSRGSTRLLDARAWSRLRLLVDVVTLYLAASAALFADARVPNSGGDRWLAALFPIGVILMMRARRSPDDRLNGSLLDTSAHVLGVTSLVTMLAISVDALLGGAHPLGLPLRLWLFTLVYLGTARVVLLSVRRQAMRSQAFSTPTLIVGAGLVGAHLVKRLTEDPGYGLRPVGFLDSDPLPLPIDTAGDHPPVLGGPEELPEAIQATGARHVILAFSSEPDHSLVAKVKLCQELDVGVSLVPRMYELINERSTLDHVGGVPLLGLQTVDPRSWQFAIKHAIDRGSALFALVLLSPLIAAIALGVRLTSPGPVLFRQRRVGRDGHGFDLLKFRTMRQPDMGDRRFELPEGVAPGGVEGDDRRTGIGRVLRDLSLDELPQLYNVLRGDMSLVGPRPERPEFVARFVRDVARYEDRHRVKSGITGWAQVHGLRGQTSIADRVEWDNYYIQNWSLRLDLRILALTVAEVLRFRG